MFDPTVLTAMGAGLGGFAMRYLAQRASDRAEEVKLMLQKGKAQTESANQAAKRGTHLGRRVVAFTIVGVFMGGLLIASWFGIEVSQVFETSGGWFSKGGHEVITTTGLTLPPWTSQAVLAVVFFYLSSSTVK